MTEYVYILWQWYVPPPLFPGYKLNNPKQPAFRMFRWMIVVSVVGSRYLAWKMYVLLLEYVPGGENKIADYLSRVALEQEVQEDVLDTPTLSIYLAALSEDEWEECMRKAENVTQLKDMIIKGWPNKCSDIKEELKDY